MAPLGGGVVEMLTRRCSIEAASGAPIGRWFRARGEEIGVEVGVVDNGGTRRGDTVLDTKVSRDQTSTRELGISVFRYGAINEHVLIVHPLATRSR
jgi:hypothetical protein